MIEKLKEKIITSIVLGACVFLVLSLYADLGQIKLAIPQFNWIYLPAIITLASSNYLIRFIKWDYYLKLIQIDLSRKESLMIFLSGLVMSITPGKFGEVLKSYLLKEVRRIPISSSAPVVLAERLTDLIALVLLSTLGVFTFHYGGFLLLVSAIVIFGSVMIISSQALSRWMIQLFDKIPFFSQHTQKVYNSYQRMYQLVTLKSLLIAIPLSLLAWLLESIGFSLILKGFSFPLPLEQSIFIYAFSIIAGAVTMLPGGIGVTEGSMAGLLILIAKIPKSIAVVATLILRICTLWFAVMIGALSLRYLQGKFLVPPIET